MNSSSGASTSRVNSKSNQNIQVYVRVRPLNTRERNIRSNEVVEVPSSKDITVRTMFDSKMTKKFSFDKAFGPESKQSEVYQCVVAPLIEEVLSGYNCTVFAYGQTGTGKTHTMIGTETPELKSSWEDDSSVGIIPRALSHLFDELRLMAMEFSMRVSYLELYNEELCDLLSSDDSLKIKIYDDSTKKGSVIIHGLEEIPVHSKDDVYKLLEKGQERRKTATTLMNAQSSRSHTVFSILVHIRENGIDGEEMLKIGKLNLVDLAGSENISKAGNEKGIRTRETVNINQSLLTLGRVITALVERTPHIPYRESKLTRLLQESLGGRTKTSIIATVSPGHKDLEETLSTLDYAHRAKNIQNKPEVNQKLTKKTVLREYTEEIDRLKRDLMAARDKNGIYLAEETYNDIHFKIDSQNKELNEKIGLIRALKEDLVSKERLFNEVSLNLVEKCELLNKTEKNLAQTQVALDQTQRVLTTTKRRYKEKKVLLDCHMKTEIKLTNQAGQLISVADEATGDTVELHNTIERRKAIDSKNLTACQHFTVQVKDSFGKMIENLESLDEKHKTYSDLILEGLASNSKIHKIFTDSLLNRLSNLVENQSKSLKSINHYIETHENQLGTENDGHRIGVSKFTDQIIQIQNSLKTDIETFVHETKDAFDKQSSLVESRCNLLKMKVEENRKMIEIYSDENSATLNELSEDVQRSLRKAEENINETVEAQKKNVVERSEKLAATKSVLSELFESLNLMGDLDCKSVVKFEKIAENLHLTSDVLKEGVNASVNFTKNISGKSNEKKAELTNEVKNLEAQLAQTILDIRTPISIIEEKSAQTNVVNQNLVAQITTSVQNHCENSKSTNNKFKNEVSDHITKTTEETDTEKKTIDLMVREERNRLEDHKTQNVALCGSLDGNLKEFSSNHSQQINDCKELLERFQNHEIQSYQPTGQTPAKKEFSYPRVLATTSPDARIIKRVRTEETSLLLFAPAPEDTSANIHEISEDSIILHNSTPLKSTKEISPPDMLLRSLSISNDFNFQRSPEKFFKNSTAGNIEQKIVHQQDSSALNSCNENKENMD